MIIRNIISFYNIDYSIFQPIDFGFKLKEHRLQTIRLRTDKKEWGGLGEV
jgi:hypothetical protein